MARYEQAESLNQVAADVLDGRIAKPATGLGTPGTTGISHQPLIARGPADRHTQGPIGTQGPVTTLYANSGSKSKKSTRKKRRKRKLDMKLRIIEAPKQSVLTNAMRKSIESDVQAELNRIAGKLKKSGARFKVDWENPAAVAPQKLDPKVLLCYVISNDSSQLNNALNLIHRSIGTNKDDAETFSKHLSNEGGVNFKRKGSLVSLSFASVARIEAYKKAGIKGLDKMFANLVLHEIGHGMDAEHEDKGVMAANQVYDSRGGVNFTFTKKSIGKIDKFLSRIK